MEQATNRAIPTGGVHCPIPSAITVITPNCTGSMPTCRAIGKRIGTRMIIAGVRSRKVPAASRMPTIISLSAIGLEVIASIPSPICCGTCSTVRSQAKGAVAPMHRTTTPVTLTVSTIER